MQLTQKEISYLKDALSHEQICVTKYNNYANQMQDTELSSMFNNLRIVSSSTSTLLTNFYNRVELNNNKTWEGFR